MSGDLKRETGVVRSFDGSMIATYSIGEGPKLPLLIANAIGATGTVWEKVLADVARERTAHLWDHRGLHASGKPASDRIDAGAHAEDAIAALDAAGVDDFVLASWSNGSRIALEIADRYPDRVRAMAIVCGGYGQSVRRGLRRLELSSLLPMGAGIAKHFAAALEGPFQTFVERPELAGMIRQSGFVGGTADTKVLVEMVRNLAACDGKRLLATFEAVAGDPAPELLATVETPTLLIAGEKDQFASVGTMREMQGIMVGSELVVYEKATHYLPIEFPARLADDLRMFLP